MSKIVMYKFYNDWVDIICQSIEFYMSFIDFLIACYAIVWKISDLPKSAQAGQIVLIYYL